MTLRVKAATGTNLAAGASWTGGTAPISTTGAQWISTSLGGALTLDSAQTWALIDIQGATSNINITGSQLTLASGSLGGTASVGINLPAAAGVDVTLNNNVVIGSGQRWFVYPGRTLTVNGVVGTSIATNNTSYTVIAQGGGTIVLTGANTFLNNTAGSWMGIYAGTTVRVNSVANGGVASPLGSGTTTAAQLRMNGGTIDYVGTGHSTNRLFTLTNNSSTIAANGSGALNFTSTGNITYTDISNVASVGRVLTLSGTSTADNTFRPNLVDGTTASGLTKSGSGIWIVSGVNTFTGTTTVSGGVLVATSTSALPGWDAASRWSVASGAALGIGNAYTDANIATLLGTGNFASGAALGFSTAAGNRTYGTAIADTAAGPLGLVKSQANTLTLSASNTYTGDTTIYGGVLELASTGKLYNAGPNDTAIITVETSGTLRVPDYSFAGMGQLADSAGRRVLDGGVIEVTGSTSSGQNFTANATTGGTFRFTQAGQTLTLTGNETSNIVVNGPLTYDAGGNIAVDEVMEGTGSVRKTGAGTLTLSASNGYAGGTTISAGTLVVGHTNALGSASGALAANGGTLDLNGRSITVGLLSGSSGATITSNIAGSAALTASSATSGTYGGVIADGSGGGIVALTKSGAGALVLTGSNSYTGGTTINGGVLQTGTGTAAGSLPATGTVTVNSGGEWRLFRSDAGVAVASPLAGSGTVTFQGIGTSGSSSYSLNGNNSAFTGQFVVQSGARLNTNGNVNATGNAALIDVQSGGQLLANRDVAAPLNIGGVGWQENAGQLGAIRLASNAVLSGSIALQGNSRVTAYSVSSGTLAGVVSGAFALDLQYGTIGLSGSNTFSGGANLGVANGATTIALGNAAAFGTGTVALVASTTTTIRADVSGTVANAFSLGSGVVGGFNTQANTLTLAGAVGGDGGLTKSGPGALRLLGSNAYAGATVIASGTLEVAGNGTLGGGAYAGTISNTGAFVVSSSANQTLSGPINGSGSLAMAGSGTLTLTGSNGYTGATAVDAGVLRIGAGGVAGSLASSSISVASGALLAFNRTDTYGGALSSLISGSGGVRVDTGFLTLAGLNTYTGPTDVLAGGTLGISGGLANSVLTVASGATLMGSGTIAGLATIAGFHRPGNSPGIETFTNGLTYASSGNLVWELWANTVLDRGTNYDGVDVTGGALTIDPSATLQLDFGTLAQGSTVDWSNSFWATNRQWTIIDVSGGATWNGSPFFNLVIGTDALGQSLTSVRGDATFTVTQSGGDLVLVYAAVPEPGTLALAGIGLVSAAWAARRRRARRHAAA